MARTSSMGPGAERKQKRRIGRLLLRGLGGIVALGVVAQLAYTYSGSSEWENLGERNGVTVYSMKSPGSNLKKFRTVWKVRSTLSRFVAFARDETLDLKIGYYDIQEFGEEGDTIHYSAWKGRFPPPLKPREFVIRNEFSQDPETRTLLYQVTAAPEKLPPDDCCVRITEMDNTWRLTPSESGELEVEWIVDMDVGLPYLVANPLQTDAMYMFANKLQGYLDMERYDDVSFEWIDDVQLE